MKNRNIILTTNTGVESTGSSTDYVGLTPGSRDPFYSSVKFLSYFRGANSSTNLIDEKGHAMTAVGGAALSTAVNDPWGNNVGVLSLGGTGTYASMASSPDWAFSATTDVTFETWIYFTAHGSSNRGLWDTGWNGVATCLWYIGITTNVVSFSGTGASDLGSGASAHPLNQWIHLATTIQGTTLRFFVNGVQTPSSYTLSRGPINANPVRVGNYNLSGTGPQGYLSNFRFTNGVARYTANFTPPTKAFANS